MAVPPLREQRSSEPQLVLLPSNFGTLVRLWQRDNHRSTATVSELWQKGGAGGWHNASVSGCLPLAAPIGLSPLLILTLCGSERVLVVSTEPPDDLSCLTTPGVGCPRDGLLPVPLTKRWGGSLSTRPSHMLPPSPPPPPLPTPSQHWG